MERLLFYDEGSGAAQADGLRALRSGRLFRSLGAADYLRLLQRQSFLVYSFLNPITPEEIGVAMFFRAVRVLR